MFWDDLLKDKTVVINFMFTGCSQICPLTTARLAEVKEGLGDSARDVHFYSISVDPLNDTPSALKKFSDPFNIGDQWLFLTGDLDELAQIRDRLGERSRDKSQHQSLVILANTKTGEWKKDSAMSEIERLVANIRDLDPAWRARPQLLANNIDGSQWHNVANVPGQALFLKACSNCHTIGKGEKIGPDLAGVSVRRNKDWLMSYLQKPDVMREKGDPVAVELFERYGRVAMPNLQLSENDASDVLNYIEYSGRMAANPAPSPNLTNNN